MAPGFGPRPPTASTLREHSFHDPAPPGAAVPTHHHQSLPLHQPPSISSSQLNSQPQPQQPPHGSPPAHPSLPSMRMPQASDSAGPQGFQTALTQETPSSQPPRQPPPQLPAHPSAESRRPSRELANSAQAAVGAKSRPGDSILASASMPNWRSADSYTPASAQSLNGQGPANTQSSTVDSEIHGS